MNYLRQCRIFAAVVNDALEAFQENLENAEKQKN